MLKSCKYCCGIHDSKYVCPSKPVRIKEPTRMDKFRWSKAWQKKRKQMNERDKYLCQVCIRMLHNTMQQYNYTNIEVHHIIPIVEDWDLRLEDDNLICLCSFHHKIAESREISRQELSKIVKEMSNY